MADGRLIDKNGRFDGRSQKDNLPCSNPVYIGVSENYGRLLGLFQNGGNLRRRTLAYQFLPLISAWLSLAVFILPILPIPHVKVFLLWCRIGKIGRLFPAIHNHTRMRAKALGKLITRTSFGYPMVFRLSHGMGQQEILRKTFRNPVLFRQLSLG